MFYYTFNTLRGPEKSGSKFWRDERRSLNVFQRTFQDLTLPFDRVNICALNCLCEKKGFATFHPLEAAQVGWPGRAGTICGHGLPDTLARIAARRSFDDSWYRGPISTFLYILFSKTFQLPSIFSNWKLLIRIAMSISSL